MDSSEEEEEDDDDKGEEWQGDRSSAVSPTSMASRAATQRSTAGSLHRSTSELAHMSVWTGHTHAHAQTHTQTHTVEENTSSYIVKTRGQERDKTESRVRVGLICVQRISNVVDFRTKGLQTVISPTLTATQLSLKHKENSI